jgi:hypothetical protein
MARQKVAPDENLLMSQASGQSDEKKISSGVSQSRKGDELIEIVQYKSFMSPSKKLPDDGCMSYVLLK